MPRQAPTDHPDTLPPGMRPFGYFDGDTLVAKMVDRDFDSHFGGDIVPTCGIAGVTTVAERRGAGLLTPLFRETLRAARERGAAISTLFPSAPRIYLGFGYELVGDYVSVDLPTAALAEVPAEVPRALSRGGSLSVRRAVAADYDDVRRIYTEWASAQNGPLTRTGPSFTATADDFIADFTGVTLALDEEGKATGYASWNRGPGYDETSRIGVADLIATSPAATATLLGVLGSFSSVAPTTRIDTSGDDLARLVLPTQDWRVVDASPYMLRLLDLPLAFGSRRFSSAISAGLRFRVAGDFLDDLNGGWLLEVSGGAARCTPSSDADHDKRGAPVFDTRGLGPMYAGVQSAANLRMAGLLSGDAGDDATWDALFGGRQFHIRDYF